MAPVYSVFLVTVSMFWLWRFCIAGQRVDQNEWNRLTLEPPFIYVDRNRPEIGHRVTVRCEYTGPPASDKVTLYLFQIKKSLNGTMQSVVETFDSGTELNVPDAKGIEINGSMVNDSFVEISFKEATCDDEALYQCYTNFYIRSLGAPKECYNVLYLSVNGPVTVTVSPEDRSSWNVGDEVTLSCMGPAPKNRTHTKEWKIELVWEFRDPGNDAWLPFDPSQDTGGSTPANDNNATDLTTAPIDPPTTFTSLTNDDDDDDDTTTAVPSGVEVFAETPGKYCNYTVSEVVRIRLRKDYLGREFRCFMRVNNESFSEYGDSVTIDVQDSEERDDDNGTGKDGQWSLAMIGSLSAGGLLLLLSVGALACFLGRCYQQQDDTDQGKAGYHTRDNGPNLDESLGSEVSLSNSQGTSDPWTGVQPSGQSTTQ